MFDIFWQEEMLNYNTFPLFRVFKLCLSFSNNYGGDFCHSDAPNIWKVTFKLSISKPTRFYSILGRCSEAVAERTSYFCLARKLIWPLWSLHIFTQWGWLILFSPDHFPRQHKNGESPPNYLFHRTFRAGRTYFLSAPFIVAESQHHGESRLIYIPFEFTLLDQGFPVEHELDACNPLLTGTLLCRL